MGRLAILLTMLMVSSAVQAAEKSITLKVENMTCATCPVTVRAALRGVAGVKDVKVDFAEKVAVVLFDDGLTNANKLAEASRNAGFPASIKE